MEIIALPADMQRWSESARRRGETIAFVPTMGFLHEGHLTLMREGRKRATLLASSLFVNPTQFGPNEDFSRYPRNFEHDCALMREVPVDVLFAPEPDVMYPHGSQTWVEVTEMTKGLCGAHRPGHFRGVTTVVAKLFNIDVEIVPVATVREPDGLAMSSRNAYLSHEDRKNSLALSGALHAAERVLSSGARDPRQLVEAARRCLETTPEIELEYVEAVDAKTLEAVERIERPVVVAIAARVGGTRRMDNIVLNP